ncbi:hypothetical protein KI387_035595, partial [Taxus chinensis]
YVKHIVYTLAKKGWKTVVANHRGLGGTSIRSDRFYNAGWTEDLRRIVGYLQDENPKAPLLAVGTSIGANILVKYLGEEGKNTPIAGAAAICCPWDLVRPVFVLVRITPTAGQVGQNEKRHVDGEVCDRFINRSLVQRLYNKILTTGLRGYAQMHQSTHARIADWECVKKSRSVRDFDNYFTCRISQYATVDTYYRRCSSAYFLSNVSVPLLCVNALDDPVCTKEAIPWDECRENKNVVLATTLRGGHLAYFEGSTAKSIWWVRAVDEYLSVLHSSSLMHSEKEASGLSSTLSSPIDKGPYLNVYHDGMVSAHESSFMQPENNGEDRREENLFISIMAPSKILDQNRCVDDKKPLLALDTYQSVEDSKLAKDSIKEVSNFVLCSSEEGKLEKGSSNEETKFAKGRKEEESDLKHADEEMGSTFKICIKGGTEYVALQSALQQVLGQMVSSKGEAMSNAGSRFVESNVPSQSRAFEESVHASPCSHLVVCNSDTGACENVESGSSIKQSAQKQSGGKDVSKTSIPIAKRIMHISRPQRCSIWALAYIALVTAWPLVGSALMLNLRKRYKNIWGIGWSRK